MTRNTALKDGMPLPDALAGRSIVLVGLMGAGKTSIGRRLAARLGMPFRDADTEIELAAGCTVPELFARYGETAFRDGERRVIRRLLAAEPLVLAFGGGAFLDPATRATVRDEAVSVWLRCDLPTLLRRVAGRDHRPLLQGGDRGDILRELMAKRYPVYAEADIVVDCGDETPDATTAGVLAAVLGWRRPRRLSIALSAGSYDVVIGDGLLARAGAHLAPVLPQKRAMIVTDETVAGLHLATLRAGLDQAGIAHGEIVVKPGEASKDLDTFASVVDGLLAAGVERRTSVIALGGGVVGDLAGFAAVPLLRRLPLSDALTIVAVTVITVLANLATAVLCGVLISAIAFAWKHADRLSVNREELPNGGRRYRLRGTLYFAATARLMAMFDVENDPAYVELDCAEAHLEDHSAVEAIEALRRRYAQQGKQLHVTRLNDACEALLTRVGGAEASLGAGSHT